MKTFLINFFIFCLTISIAQAMPASPPSLENGKVFVTRDGKKISPEHGVYVVPLKDVDLSVVVFGDFDADKAKHGFYFYKKDSQSPYAFAPEPKAGAFTDTAVLSPDKKLLFFALPDASELVIYSFPDLTLQGRVPYSPLADTPIFVQKGKNWGLLLTQVQEFGGDPYAIRQCQYDPCEATSAAFYDIVKKTTTILNQGSATCNYSVQGFENGKVLVGEICLDKPSDWKNFSAKKPTVLKKSLK